VATCAAAAAVCSRSMCGALGPRYHPAAAVDHTNKLHCNSTGGALIHATPSTSRPAPTTPAPIPPTQLLPFPKFSPAPTHSPLQPPPPPHRGNLAEFVKKKPEAKAYYQLAAVALKFNFPEPGFLDGVTSKEKPIVKLTKVRAGAGLQLGCSWAAAGLLRAVTQQAFSRVGLGVGTIDCLCMHSCTALPPSSPPSPTTTTTKYHA
jgi:hypothetical protein